MFTPKDVMALREKTGVGMMDCKKALTETNGDMEKAIEYLREKGMAAAATLIMFIPNLIIFIVMQKQVMDTMAHSGIK